MNKAYITLFALPFMVHAFANTDSEVNQNLTLSEEQIVQAAEETGVVRYVVTVYKDRNGHDKILWEQSIRQLLQLAETQEDLIVDELCKTIKTMYAHRGETIGIHGELEIGLGSGRCPENCCGDDCECLKRYKGMCPCSIEGVHCSACKIGADKKRCKARFAKKRKISAAEEKCGCNKPKPKTEENKEEVTEDKCGCNKPKPATEEPITEEKCGCNKPKPKTEENKEEITEEKCGCNKPKPKA